MRQMHFAVRIGMLSILAAGVPLSAAVKTEQKSQVKFEGMMGRMMGLFGGKAAKEGVVDTVAVKGNRKARMSEYGGEIIDLDEERVYTLDARKKTYDVMTFAEMKRRMEEARENAAKQARRESAEDTRQPQDTNMEVEINLKESGQKKNINGFDCREVVMTVTAHQKGKTLDQAGGMVLTSNMWLAPRIAAMKEAEDFDRRYAEKLGEIVGMPSAEQAAAALAMYPGLQDMMRKMQSEKVNMEGTPILTVMTLESVASPEQMRQQKENESSDNSPARGIGGLIGRRIMRKKEEAPSQAGNRATIMRMDNELIRVTPDVSAADLAVPPGYKQKD